MLDVQLYQWIADERYSAITLAIIEGTPEDEVIRAYGGDPAAAEMATFDDAFNTFSPGDPFHVQTLTTGSFVVAIENNGYLGVELDGDLAIVADKGRFASVKWSATGGIPFLYIVHGETEADFDALSLASGASGGGGPVPDWAHEAKWSPDTVEATCLALMSNVMGVQVEEAWFTTPQRTTRLPGLD